MGKNLREEKFKAMKLPELKAYLKIRATTVNSYLKPGLVAIACAAEEMSLPVLCKVTEADEKLNLSCRLKINDVQLLDPFKMDVLNNFKNSPSFDLFDIFNHLIYHSSEYDLQGLAPYKSYENWNNGRKAYSALESNNQANAESFLRNLKFSEKDIDNVAFLTKSSENKCICSCQLFD